MVKSPLLKKFLLFLLLTSILPLILVGMTSYNISKSIIEEQATVYTLEFMQGQKVLMEVLMEEVEGLIANILSIEEIKNVANNSNADNDDFTRLVTQAKIGHILGGYTHLKGLVSIDIFTDRNSHYHVGDTLDIRAINTTVKDKLYQQVLASPQKVVWVGVENNVNGNSRHKKVITAAKAMTIIESQTLQEKTVGLLLINYSVDNFYDYFHQDIGEHAYMMIMDGENRLVFFSKKDRIGHVVESAFVQSIKGDRGAFVADVFKQKMLVTFSRSPKSNWLLVSVVPVDTLTASTKVIRNNTVLVLSCCFIVVLLAALLVSKRVVAPINKITGLFKEIQTGNVDFNMRLQETTNDEIGELVKWFNTFLHSLADKRIAEEELRIAHAELEKRVLQRTAELAVTNQSLREEIACREKSEQELKFLSFHDPLTGLNNRASFERELDRLKNIGGSDLSIIICDIDGLKLVNDSMGHNNGDLLMINTARIIKEIAGEHNFIARIGGDEFAVIVYSNEKARVENICSGIRTKVEEYSEGDSHLPLSVSVGYASCTQGLATPEDVSKAADNNMYREKLYRSNSARSAIVTTMMKALEERDFITEGHVERVQRLVVDMGAALGFSERKLTDLRLFAQFHDIGKVGISDHILKNPGFLTPEETVEMWRHSEIGYRIAKSAPDLLPIADWILKHHEWWDGGGYPLRLQGEEIPLECRILAIADAYDAMTSNRPYRKTMTHETALTELFRCAGTQFDPQLVPLFSRLFSKDTS